MTGLKFVVLPALVLVVAGLSGCGRHRQVNPPTEPAQAINEPDVAAPATGSAGGRVSGTGPASFVGRWAADVSWCANPQGEHSPIQITPIRFEAHGNSCHIYSVDETATGYLAVLQCQSQDAKRQERVHLSVVDHVLTLTYPDQGDAQVRLHQCTSLADVAPPSTPTSP
jgi:hypothetical protein